MEINKQVNLLVLVVSCKKHQHIWKKILERNVPNLIIICGGSEETKLDGNILYLTCNDAYDGLSEKMMKAYEYILNSGKFNFTHILKADDHDTEFTSEQIQNIQEKYINILNTKDYIGQNLIHPSQMGRGYHHYKVPKDSPWYTKMFSGPDVSYLSGGQTYILSKYSVNLIIKYKNEFYTYDSLFNTYGGLEDIMVGSILIKYNIIPYELKYGIRTWYG